MQHVLVTRLRASFNPKAKIKESSLRFGIKISFVVNGFKIDRTIFIEHLRYQIRRNLTLPIGWSVIYRERISPLLLLPRILSRDTLMSRAATTRRIYNESPSWRYFRLADLGNNWTAGIIKSLIGFDGSSLSQKCLYFAKKWVKKETKIVYTKRSISLKLKINFHLSINATLFLKYRRKNNRASGNSNNSDILSQVRTTY